jgi:DNA repair protein RecO (recombination protein O)
MEWDAPAIVLDARPYGEGDAIVTVMTEDHGAHRGLVRGGTARAHVATWQAGNFVQVRWIARLADQLGHFNGEVIHANAAHVMDDPLALAMLTSACAVAEGALPERAPHPGVFAGLLRLIAHLPLGQPALPGLIRWETVLLAELGYGLDLTRCAVSGETSGLAYVSPRTGRAVTAAAAGIWSARLLALPAFLVGAGPDPMADLRASPATTPTLAALRDGMRLTGHFLARDAFGQRHRPLPRARVMLYDRLAARADESETQNAG